VIELITLDLVKEVNGGILGKKLRDVALCKDERPSTSKAINLVSKEHSVDSNRITERYEVRTNKTQAASPIKAITLSGGSTLETPSTIRGSSTLPIDSVIEFG
jgi:hypothetical protein